MGEALRLERVLLDAGVLCAIADRRDAWHRRCAAFVERFDGRLLVPSTVLPEACHLLGEHLGRRGRLRRRLGRRHRGAAEGVGRKKG